eukprot:129208-Hanusia_phi.AAC.2
MVVDGVDFEEEEVSESSYLLGLLEDAEEVGRVIEVKTPLDPVALVDLLRILRGESVATVCRHVRRERGACESGREGQRNPPEEEEDHDDDDEEEDGATGGSIKKLVNILLASSFLHAQRAEDVILDHFRRQLTVSGSSVFARVTDRACSVVLPDSLGDQANVRARTWAIVKRSRRETELCRELNWCSTGRGGCERNDRQVGIAECSLLLAGTSLVDTLTELQEHDTRILAGDGCGGQLVELMEQSSIAQADAKRGDVRREDEGSEDAREEARREDRPSTACQTTLFANNQSETPRRSPQHLSWGHRRRSGQQPLLAQPAEVGEEEEEEELTCRPVAYPKISSALSCARWQSSSSLTMAMWRRQVIAVQTSGGADVLSEQRAGLRGDRAEGASARRGEGALAASATSA